MERRKIRTPLKVGQIRIDPDMRGREFAREVVIIRFAKSYVSTVTPYLAIIKTCNGESGKQYPEKSIRVSTLEKWILKEE